MEATGITWAFLRPTNFASNSLAWAQSVRAEGIVRAPFGTFRSAVIDPRDIAAVAVAELRSPDRANRVHRLTGPRVLGLTDQVAIIGEVLGRDITFAEQTRATRLAPRCSPAACRRPSSTPSSPASAARSTTCRTSTTPSPQITGRPATPYRDWVAANRDAFA